MKKSSRIFVWLSKIATVLLAMWSVNTLIFSRTAARRRTKIKERFYEWRYGDVRYITLGSGKPLLLVHTPGSSLYEWERNLSSLSRHFKVYALDLIGFGYSDKPDIDYSSYLYVTLLNDFIRDIIGQKTNIIASGLSGAHAVMAYTFEPDNYGEMMLISPTGVGTRNDIAQKDDLWKKWLIESPLVGTTLFNILCSHIGLRWFMRTKCFYESGAAAGDLVDKYYRALHFGGPNARYPMAALLSNFLNVNIESKLAKLNIPVDIVWGENNLLNPIGNFEVIEKLNPSIELTIFERTGAMPHMENPKAFYRECKRFFKS